MGIFGTSNPSGQAPFVRVPPFVVRTSRVTPNEDPTQDPTWGDFKNEPRLAVGPIRRGSTAGDRSGAELRLVTGPPFGPQIDVENAAEVLKVGDRVVIGLPDRGKPGGVLWLFGGYCTKVRTTIGNREQCSFSLSGPEWVWGGPSAGAGAHWVIDGQVRRGPAGDAAYLADVDTLTPAAQLVRCTDLPAVFNPDGRGNATVTNIVLSELDEEPERKARVWEEPDRRATGEEISAKWTMRQAVNFLCQYWNDPEASGIAVPDFDELSEVIPEGRIIRDVNVDGLGLWAALAKVIGPEFGFYVTTAPLTVAGDAWAGFRLKFFARSVGEEADLWVNPRGTSLYKARASVTRCDWGRDVGKVVNRVGVQGSQTRFIKLLYYGGLTPGLTNVQGKAALQHGWKKSEGDLSTFAGTGYGGGQAVDINTIESKDADTQKLWRDRYTTRGREFAAYGHVFRLFVWNEAAEWFGGEGDERPAYGPAGTVVDWTVPELEDIADDPDHPGQYCRRRRPLLDTLYPGSKVDGYSRVPPSLYMTVTANSYAAEPMPSGPWVRVNNWEKDPDRAAIRLKHEDLAEWFPLEKCEELDDQLRYLSFATLLHLGRLRMMLECSVQIDQALERAAERTAESGSPLVREVVTRKAQDFLKTFVYPDVLTNPTSLTPAEIDHGADALAMAEHQRAAGQDAQIHSSISVAADAGEEHIGRIVRVIKGRNIDLSSAGARGAQIVAMTLDVQGMRWELLTESAAMESRRAANAGRFSRRRKRRGRFRTPGVES